MASPKLCIHCQKPATIHLTQIVDGKIHKIDLCEACAHVKGLDMPQSLELDELISKVSEAVQAEHPSQETAPAADSPTSALSGATFNDFKKTGRLGSADCYSLFRTQLEPLLKNMHRGVRHCGKVPEHAPLHAPEQPAPVPETQAQAAPPPVPARTRAVIEAELRSAIAEERFEDAARLRDELRAQAPTP